MTQEGNLRPVSPRSLLRKLYRGDNGTILRRAFCYGMFIVMKEFGP
jgi:hypothetical protein